MKCLMLAMLLVPLSAAGATPPSQIERLVEQFKASRSSATLIGTACPPDIEALYKLNKEQVYARLGDPDFCSEKDCTVAERWGYLLISYPLIRSIPDTGGTPELAIMFRETSQVVRAECTYTE